MRLIILLLALTVSGSGNSTNLNLFIPIAEGLKALNIEVKK
jgi:hypothetical protein